MTLDQKALAAALLPWRYSINYGPDGEENWANVYDELGDLVGNLRTHHARAIVEAVNLPIASLPAPEPVATGDVDDTESIAHALMIAAMATPCRDYQGSIYFAHNNQYPDAEFRDYGLARAFRVICNNAKAIEAALYPSPPSHQGLREALAGLVEAAARYAPKDNLATYDQVYLMTALSNARAALQSQPTPSGETK